MVLRTGKERANLLLLYSKVPSTYAGIYAARKPSSAVLTLRLVAMLLLSYCLKLFANDSLQNRR
jgi:hypothetical protein